MVDTKVDLSEKLNALLGLDPPVVFEKLKRSDLERVYEAVSKIPSLVQVGARASLERVMGGPAAKATRELWNMPIMQRWRELRKSGGLVGLLEKKVKERTGEDSGRDEESADST